MANSDADNRSNQLNPNNDAYYQSRGYDGRDDYHGDEGEYVGPYISSCSEGPTVLTFEQKELRFLNDKQRQIASSMTSSKASEILWNRLLHSFPELEINAHHADGVLFFEFVGCSSSPGITRSVTSEVESWISDRAWLIEGCVKDVRLFFTD